MQLTLPRKSLEFQQPVFIDLGPTSESLSTPAVEINNKLTPNLQLSQTPMTQNEIEIPTPQPVHLNVQNNIEALTLDAP